MPQQNWLNLAYLGAGGDDASTTPPTGASHIFAAAEMQRAGLLLGPRIFSTGEIIYGARSGLYASSTAWMTPAAMCGG